MAISKHIFVQASIERIMKCGIGICGSCTMNSNVVCRDGTIFDGHELFQNNEFGHMYRNKTGTLTKY